MPKKVLEPRPFRDLDLGHARVHTFLDSLKRTRVPALLFTGPEGSGKAYTAVRFANQLVCDTPTEALVGDAETKASLLEHPDIHLIYPTPTQGSDEGEDGDIADTAKILEEKRVDFFAQYVFKKKVSLRVARSRAIIQRANMRPFGSAFSVFVINDAHTMREEAQNALLKLVEEPPEHAVIIFVTHNPEGILYTIRSRCQTVRFNPVPTESVSALLKGYYGTEAKVANRAAKLSHGSIKRARQLVESFDDAEREVAAAVVANLARQPLGWAVGQAGALSRSGNRDGVAKFLQELQLMFRDAMVDDPELRLNADLGKVIDKAAQQYDTAKIPGIIDRIAQARTEILVRNLNVDAALTALFAEIRDAAA